MIAKAQAIPASVDYRFERKRQEGRVYIGDATRLEQIFINLINNAIKFTKEGGSVRVQVSEEEQGEQVKLTVSVSDTGIGISEEFLPNIFDAFTQQHEGNTTVYGGSGLGLSIAQSFTEACGGGFSWETDADLFVVKITFKIV